MNYLENLPISQILTQQLHKYLTYALFQLHQVKFIALFTSWILRSVSLQYLIIRTIKILLNQCQVGQ